MIVTKAINLIEFGNIVPFIGIKSNTKAEV